MFRIFLKDIVVDYKSDSPVLELSFNNGKNCLNVYVEKLEAETIAGIMCGDVYVRPSIYDLTVNIMKKSGIVLEKVIINTTNNILCADMVFEQNGIIFTVDSNPGDAIGISIRNNSPIFVSQTLIEKLDIDVSGMKKHVEVESFENIKPDDFM